ncbi:MAG: hypothetical protein KGH93_01920 [Patescibacteria group bacterium]|nr:hypothetical protein [Patescibacteria group bacterium]MDE1945935.1 hypothetical protein [Patescibacteria group bacterium]
MSIQDVSFKIKRLADRIGQAVPMALAAIAKTDMFVAILIILVGLASFALGRLSVLENNRAPIAISAAGETASAASALPTSPAVTGQGQGVVFASKSGSKYYSPTCSGASRVKPENRVWFPSIAAAEAAGLTPAANCPGLQ